MNFFNDFSFMTSEWTYAAGTLFFMMTAWRVDTILKKREVRHQRLANKINIYLDMKREFRQNWSKISSFPENNKELFRKSLSELQNDELRTCIYHVIDILSDAYYLHTEMGDDINQSEWRKNFVHVFNPIEMKTFVDAYEKYKEEKQFSGSFVKYVEKIINNHKSAAKKSVQ